MLELHARGVVRVFMLTAAFAAVAIGCAAAPHVAPVSAHVCANAEVTKAGRLRACELSEPTRVQGHDFPRGARLTFHDDGSLERAEFVEARGFMIHGEAWRDTATVDYDRSGAEIGKHVERWQSGRDVRHDPVPRKFR
jgi:hypothetical protein